MAKLLFTGMWTFTRPDAVGRQFGAAGGTSAPEGSGSVLITLDLRQVPLYVDSGFANVRMPEEWAAELSRVLGDSVLRLRHLRGLYKLEQLAPSALYDDDANAELTGVRILGDEPVAKAIEGYVAPRSVSSPRLECTGLRAVLSYDSFEGRHVYITFTGLDSIRTVRGAPYEIPPEFGRRPEELRAAIVHGSHWLEERRPHLPADSTTMHHVFFFTDEVVEALAQGFHVDDSPPDAASSRQNEDR